MLIGFYKANRINSLQVHSRFYMHFFIARLVDKRVIYDITKSFWSNHSLKGNWIMQVPVQLEEQSERTIVRLFKCYLDLR